jgi:hypothetical protein
MNPPRNITLALFAALFLILTTNATTAEERIVIAFDDDCTSCSTSIGIGQQAIARIRAVRGDFIDLFGFRGANFRVAGLPNGWTVDCVPNPTANVVLGAPFEEGVSMAFPGAYGLGGSCLELYTCTITATSSDTATLEVVAPSSPNISCPQPTCPCVNLANSPFQPLCAVGGQAYINGPGCTVSVKQRTWSQVKRLFD